jgi:hypothetical protein
VKLLIPVTLLLGCPSKVLLAVGADEIGSLKIRSAAIATHRRTAALDELGADWNRVGWNLVSARDDASVEKSLDTGCSLKRANFRARVFGGSHNRSFSASA